MKRWRWITGGVIGLVLLSCAGLGTHWAIRLLAQMSPRNQTSANPALPSYTNFLGMKFVLIPAGSFMMGSPTSEKYRRRDELLHKETIDRPFWLCTTKVTVGQFRQFADQSGYITFNEQKNEGFAVKIGSISRERGITWRTPGFAQGDDHPVVCINWHDAHAFCEWLSAKDSRRYRLPREAEWEYACRAGTTSAYIWGDDWRKGAGWLNTCDVTTLARVPRAVVPGHYEGAEWDDGFAYTSPVGSFRPNAWGLYDMVGNALEYCEEVYVPYPRGEWPVYPTKVDPALRVIRGSGWLGPGALALLRGCRLRPMMSQVRETDFAWSWTIFRPRNHDGDKRSQKAGGTVRNPMKGPVAGRLVCPAKGDLHEDRNQRIACGNGLPSHLQSPDCA